MEPLKIPSQTHSQTRLCCACTFILHEGARWENNQQSHQGETILLQPPLRQRLTEAQQSF